MNDALRMIMESTQTEYRFYATVQGLARSSFSEQEGRSLKKLAESIYSYIDSLTQGIESGKSVSTATKSTGGRPYRPGGLLDKETFERVTPGTVKVLLAPGESANWELFAGANIEKD